MDNSKNEREERGVREDNSEGMSTEQAIYELKKHKKNTHYILLHKEVDDIIELLQRGEKFEKMWRSLKELIKRLRRTLGNTPTHLMTGERFTEFSIYLEVLQFINRREDKEF